MRNNMLHLVPKQKLPHLTPKALRANNSLYITFVHNMLIFIHVIHICYRNVIYKLYTQYTEIQVYTKIICEASQMKQMCE